MKPFRVERISSELQHLLSEAIRDHLQDPRIAPLTSITHVEVSGDLENAKVFVSVFGAPGEQHKTLSALQHATGYLQSIVAKRLPIHHCPQISFVSDDSIKRGQEIMQLIDESMAEIRQDQERRRASGTSSTEDLGEAE